MAGTILFCNPGLAGLLGSAGDIKVANLLGGSLVGGRKAVKVSPWNTTSFTNASAHNNMMALDSFLTKYPGTSGTPTRVVGHSLGSQIIYKWLREKGPTSPIATNTVEFYAFGCPEQRYTGASTLYPDNSPPKYPGDPAHGGTAHTGGCPTPSQFHGGWGVGYGLPTTIPWKVWCVANQYDGWADAPNDINNVEVKRVTKTFFGIPNQKAWDHSLFCLMKSTSGPHGQYDVKDSRPLTDTAVTFTYQDPVNANVKYIWQKTYPIPSLNSVKWISYTARSLDIARRPVLEQAYSHRPIAISNPVEWAAPPNKGWFG